MFLSRKKMHPLFTHIMLQIDTNRIKMKKFKFTDFSKPGSLKSQTQTFNY